MPQGHGKTDSPGGRGGGGGGGDEVIHNEGWPSAYAEQNANAWVLCQKYLFEGHDLYSYGY